MTSLRRERILGFGEPVLDLGWHRVGVGQKRFDEFGRCSDVLSRRLICVVRRLVPDAANFVRPGCDCLGDQVRLTQSFDSAVKRSFACWVQALNCCFQCFSVKHRGCIKFGARMSAPCLKINPSNLWRCIGRRLRCIVQGECRYYRVAALCQYLCRRRSSCVVIEPILCDTSAGNITKLVAGRAITARAGGVNVDDAIGTSCVDALYFQRDFSSAAVRTGRGHHGHGGFPQERDIVPSQSAAGNIGKSRKREGALS
jgi:hypothetical protein